MRARPPTPCQAKAPAERKTRCRPGRIERPQMRVADPPYASEDSCQLGHVAAGSPTATNSGLISEAFVL